MGIIRTGNFNKQHPFCLKKRPQESPGLTFPLPRTITSLTMKIAILVTIFTSIFSISARIITRDTPLTGYLRTFYQNFGILKETLSFDNEAPFLKSADLLIEQIRLDQPEIEDAAPTESVDVESMTKGFEDVH